MSGLGGVTVPVSPRNMPSASKPPVPVVDPCFLHGLNELLFRKFFQSLARESPGLSFSAVAPDGFYRWLLRTGQCDRSVLQGDSLFNSSSSSSKPSGWVWVSAARAGDSLCRDLVTTLRAGFESHAVILLQIRKHRYRNRVPSPTGAGHQKRQS